jgi:hypothetical protein
MSVLFNGEIDQLHALLLSWLHGEYNDISIIQISYTYTVWLDPLTFHVEWLVQPNEDGVFTTNCMDALP